MYVTLVAGSHPPDPCGVGDYAARLARALIRKGIRVDLLVPRQVTSAPGDRHVLPAIPSFAVPSLLGFANLVRQLGPDIIHVQYPSLHYRRTLGSRLLAALLRMRCPQSLVVVTIHEPARSRLSLAYNTLPLLAAHGAIFVESRNLLTQWGRLSKLIARRKVVRIIPIASNMPAASVGPREMAAIRQGLGVPQGATLLSYFGQLKPTKGVHLFPEILRRLPQAHLLIVGPLDNQPFVGWLRAALSEPCFANRVHFLGYLAPDDVARYLAAADAAVFPLLDGHSERSGSVLAALSQGTFTVTSHPTRRGLDGNLYYTAPGDVEETVEAIRRYAGRRGRPLDVEGQWGAIATQHVELYEELLKGMGGRWNASRRG